MVDLDDFYAFTGTESDSGSGGSSGCSGGLLWILVAVGILYVIGKLCG